MIKMKTPEFTMWEILNVLENKVGREYAQALKDHINNMNEEIFKLEEAVENETLSCKSYAEKEMEKMYAKLVNKGE